MKKRLMGEDFCLETALSPEQVEFALRSCWWLREKRSKTKGQPLIEAAEGSRTLRFVVMAGIATRNAWKPIWVCTLTEQGVEVRARCSLSTRIFMAVWFGTLAFYTVVALASATVEHNWTFLLACLGFWVFGLGLSGFAFWLPELEAKERLRELAAGKAK